MSVFFSACTNLFFIFFTAGRTTTNDELEYMLEQGNPAVFTQGVSLFFLYNFFFRRESDKGYRFLLIITHLFEVADPETPSRQLKWVLYHHRLMAFHLFKEAH